VRDGFRTDARQAILGRVRGQLGVRSDEPGRRGLVQSRLRTPQANLIPERARRPRAELIKLFQAMLEKAGAKVARVRALKGLPEAVAAQLRENGLPLRVRAGADPIFDALRAGSGGLEILPGPAEAGDAVGLSHAIAGAAETGTLFLVSGAENPSTINFLPENHLIVILASDIAGSYEDGWAKLRSLHGSGNMPRTVNLISGPSRTADIEQTIVMGAHGPKALLVLIAGS
jgi:L-lactate dehydrogenase complex protein LldG